MNAVPKKFRTVKFLRLLLAAAVCVRVRAGVRVRVSVCVRWWQLLPVLESAHGC